MTSLKTITLDVPKSRLSQIQQKPIRYQSAVTTKTALIPLLWVDTWGFKYNKTNRLHQFMRKSEKNKIPKNAKKYQISQFFMIV